MEERAKKFLVDDRKKSGTIHVLQPRLKDVRSRFQDEASAQGYEPVRPAMN
jgi:hypothetical protein